MVRFLSALVAKTNTVNILIKAKGVQKLQIDTLLQLELKYMLFCLFVFILSLGKEAEACLASLLSNNIM